MKTLKTLLFGLAVLSVMTSCSSDNDDNVIVPSTKGITFSATAPKAPSGRVITTTGTLRSFTVYGFVDNKPYMEDVKVTRAEGGGWEYSPTQFWPVDKSINFYSYSPDDISTVAPVDNISSDNPDIPEYINGGNTDLLYGVNMNQTAANPQVKINFRHALAQVVFQLRRMPDSPINVEVSAVDLLGTCNIGSFRFPRETTAEGNIDNVKGEWRNQRNVQTASIYTGSAMLSDEPKVLNSEKYHFAIPQELTQAGSKDSATLRVTCQITDEKTGHIVWPGIDAEGYNPTTRTAYIDFPLAQMPQTWEGGKAYRYTVTVGVPSSVGGIEFDVTVDEYPSYTDTEL